MMLKDEFFTIREELVSENSKVYRLALNVSHPVFSAHFAGNPVMPGACITQMIKELTTGSSGHNLFISAVKNMKFLHVINPLEHPEISVKLTNTPQEDGSLSVSALITDGDTIFSKAIVVLKPV
ncbi:MAG: 3-hydroxylacyl-ACP dehydratase [Tannerella sp.]|jgi:3-hydroxyacyl-[acyl-carrier-protein] dehydratase|nr:3-hydroxylacyl-ACP dehydratase [Tannerella sp.]